MSSHDDTQLLADLWPSVIDLAKKTALFTIPGSRDSITRIAHVLDRHCRIRRENSHADEAAGGEANFLEAAAHEVWTVLERSAPERKVGERERGPTPQTARRLQPDPIRRLLDRGSFTLRQEEAVTEIRQVFKFLRTRLGPEVRDYRHALPIDRGRRFLVRQPFDTIPASLAKVYERRFRPWSQRMAERPVVRSNVVRMSCFDLAVAVLIDERSLRSLERELGVRNGVLTGKLKEILDDYARPSPG